MLSSISAISTSGGSTSSIGARMSDESSLTSLSLLPDKRALRLRLVRVDVLDAAVSATLFLDFRDNGDEDWRCMRTVSLSSARRADWSSALEVMALLARTLRRCPLPGWSAGLSPTSSESWAAERGEDCTGASCASRPETADLLPVARLAVARLGGVGFGSASSSSAGGGAFARSYGSLFAEERESRCERRLAELDWAGGGCVGECDRGTGAAVPSGSSRLLFAEVFGLVRWAADGAGAGDGAGDGAAGDGAAGDGDGPAASEESGSGSGAGAGSGAMPGMANRLPKSAFCT